MSAVITHRVGRVSGRSVQGGESGGGAGEFSFLRTLTLRTKPDEDSTVSAPSRRRTYGEFAARCTTPPPPFRGRFLAGERVQVASRQARCQDLERYEVALAVELLLGDCLPRSRVAPTVSVPSDGSTVSSKTSGVSITFT